MCGLAGILGEDVTEHDIDLMLAPILHRGPDEFGTYIDDSVGLGSARLSIIDIKHGQQPMRDEATGVVIVYNGEVFNYRELGQEFRNEDHKLKTASDTEVILYLYLKYGMSFTEHLNGQFAIAIWDPRSQSTVLARDRFGICPLYYHDSDKLFAFSSEIKSLFTIPDIPKCINAKALDQIFTFWSPVAGVSAFADIHEVPPGHTLTYNRESGVTITAFWQWPFPSLQRGDGIDFEQARLGVRKALSKAVELRLRADIEVGSYLSGGIDSSAIVALATPLQPTGLHTFSVAFGDESYDESKYQDIVAETCGTTHHRLNCNYEDINATFEKAVYHAEVPLFRTAPTPMNLLSQSVKAAGIKVVLSGEGADEILLGYDLFREVKVRRFWQRSPESTMRPQLLKKLYAYLPQFSNPRFANMAIESYRATLMSESPFYSHAPRWLNNSKNKVYFSADLQDTLKDSDCYEDLRKTLPGEFFDVGDVDQSQYLELTTLLRGYLLSSQGDRQLMSNSVEGRFPFLDHEFVTFVNSLPQKYKIPGLKDKHVFREAFKELLPEEICHRPKFAYQAPEIRAFFSLDRTRSELVDQYLSPTSIRNNGHFNETHVASLLKKIGMSNLDRLGTRDNMAVVQMLSTQILQHRFVETDLRKHAESQLNQISFKTRIRHGDKYGSR